MIDPTNTLEGSSYSQPDQVWLKAVYDKNAKMHFLHFYAAFCTDHTLLFVRSPAIFLMQLWNIKLHDLIQWHSCKPTDTTNTSNILPDPWSWKSKQNLACINCFLKIVLFLKFGITYYTDSSEFNPDLIGSVPRTPRLQTHPTLFRKLLANELMFFLIFSYTDEKLECFLTLLCFIS